MLFLSNHTYEVHSLIKPHSVYFCLRHKNFVGFFIFRVIGLIWADSGLLSSETSHKETEQCMYLSFHWPSESIVAFNMWRCRECLYYNGYWRVKSSNKRKAFLTYLGVHGFPGRTVSYYLTEFRNRWPHNYILKCIFLYLTKSHLSWDISGDRNTRLNFSRPTLLTIKMKRTENDLATILF